jgi:transcriptional regulator with XRE-family HTH domain
MNTLNHRLNLDSTTDWLKMFAIQPTIAAMNESDNLIKARLRDLGKTQGWLAEIAGVSVNAVSKWTKNGPIARENVVAVADALGITADQLLKGTQPPADQRSDLVKLSAIEQRILALYNGADDRGKLDMLASIEEIAKQVEEERRKSPHDAQRAHGGLERRTHQLGLVDQSVAARRKS